MIYFPLHSVLGYKKRLEDQAQLALAKARQEYQTISDQRQAEEQRLLHIRKEFEQDQSQGIDGISLVLYQQCLDSITHGLRQMDLELARAEQKVMEKKQDLYKACTDKKKLDKLKERHAQRSKAESNRLETIELDEVAIYEWGRNG
jgi:flagellar export protein FliJ